MTQSEFGGAQRFIYTLVNSLHKHEIVVGAGPEGDDENGLLFKLEKNRINTRHLKYLRRGINPFFDFCLGLIEIYRLIQKERPEILFLCSSKAGAMGSLIGRLLKVPKIIYRIGGWTFNDPWPKWKKNFYLCLEKISAKWKDYIINNAESDRQQAIKLGIKPQKDIRVIYNGIDADELKNFSKQEAKELLGIKSKLIIGTIANFYPAKGIEFLVEAANILKESDAEFALIGEGRDKKKIRKLIASYKLEKKFYLVGDFFTRISRREADKYLKAFDIFVLPSVKEGFPSVILEAMAAEIPVIATKVGAIPEIIQDGKNGILVEPKNPKAIAKAIDGLLKNPNLGHKLAKLGRKTVIEKFNLNKMIKQYEDLFSIN